MSWFQNIVHTKDQRNKMLRNNILLSSIFKATGLLTSLIIVPITLNYLDKEQYGIWLTMSSILYWFVFLDPGLGNGMRNYLTQSISMKDYEKARSYLTTTLFLLSCIAIVFALVSIAALYVFNLNKVFNTQLLEETTLRNVMIVAITFTLIGFVVRNIGLIFAALQKYAITDFLAISGNVIALLIILVLTQTTECNLLYVVSAFTITPVAVYVIAAVPIFAKYPMLRPAKKYIDMGLAKQVVGKGLGFFMIQVTSCLVIFGSSNLFITQYCGPDSVTTYNIAYKYFHLISVVVIIFISPLWNAYTDAWVKKDIVWIKKAFHKSLYLLILSIAAGLVMLLICNWFYGLWVGSSIEIPFSVSVSVFIYLTLYNFNNCVTYLLNGLNKIRVQVYTSIFFTAVYIVTIIAIDSHHSIESIVMCMSACYGLMSVIHFYQCNLLISQKAKGVWNK